MKYVVVGGGISGVCCVEELAQHCPDAQITLVSASDTLKVMFNSMRVLMKSLKYHTACACRFSMAAFHSRRSFPQLLHSQGVRNVVQLTKNIEELEIEIRKLSDLPYPNVTVVQGVAAGLNTATNQLLLSSGARIDYDKICVCTGAQPRTLANHPHVITLRDSESIEDLTRRLEGGSRRVVVVGNGGIALELVALLRGVEASPCHMAHVLLTNSDILSNCLSLRRCTCLLLL